MLTRQDVADTLGMTDKRLCFILYGRMDRRRYGRFEIPKRGGGIREICSPPRSLYWLQSQMYQRLLTYYKPKACVHGFVPSRSIATNAMVHIRRRLLVNFDLKDFFPSIHLGRVIGIFTHHPFLFGAEAATVLAQICCRDDGTLPQGGIMSPLMSNLVCRGLDNDLLTFAKKHKLRYSRYADDLTFSTSRPSLPPELVDLTGPRPVSGPILVELVTSHGFDIHPNKVKFRRRSRRQEVTGLTVNQFPNVDRRYIRQLDSALFAWSKYGYAAAQSSYESAFRTSAAVELSNLLRGRLAFVKMVCGEHDFIYRRLVRRFNRLSPKPISLPLLADAQSCALHNCALPWNKWASKYSNEVFHLLFRNAEGDEASGSAFHVGGGVLITAGHNVTDERGVVRVELRVKIGARQVSAEVLPCTAMVPSTCDVGYLKVSTTLSANGIPTQLRLPEVGEEVAAIGFPKVPQRAPTQVMHAGTVEALPVNYMTNQRFIQVSFQSGGALSGGCLIDKSGLVLGVMVGNVYMLASPPQPLSSGAMGAPDRPYGQAVPMEYADQYFDRSAGRGEPSRTLPADENDLQHEAGP